MVNGYLKLRHEESQGTHLASSFRLSQSTMRLREYGALRYIRRCPGHGDTWKTNVFLHCGSLSLKVAGFNLALDARYGNPGRLA